MKKVPLPLKRVRKGMPPPGKVFEDQKKYNRKRAREELKRALKESSLPPDSPSARNKRGTS